MVSNVQVLYHCALEGLLSRLGEEVLAVGEPEGREQPGVHTYRPEHHYGQGPSAVWKVHWRDVRLLVKNGELNTGTRVNTHTHTHTHIYIYTYIFSTGETNTLHSETYIGTFAS